MAGKGPFWRSLFRRVHLTQTIIAHGKGNFRRADSRGLKRRQNVEPLPLKAPGIIAAVRDLFQSPFLDRLGKPV